MIVLSIVGVVMILAGGAGFHGAHGRNGEAIGKHLSRRQHWPDKRSGNYLRQAGTY